MLVLTRKTTDTIRIGPDITVTILRVTGRAVKVGIEAPDHVAIRRGDIVAVTVPVEEICPGPPVGNSKLR